MIQNIKYTHLTIKSISLLYVLLFVYAAVSKLLDFETFTLQLAQSPLLSTYAGFISWGVPATEIVIAIFLIIPQFRIFALYASFLLMIMFTAYIYIILNFSDFIPCSCGGVLEKLNWTQHLIFNIVFIVLAGTAILLSGNWTNKMKLLLLAILTIIGVGLLTMVFAFSEKKIFRNEAFQRKYIPNALEYIGNYELGSKNFYIAGFKKNIIYFGNYQNPLYLKTLTTQLGAQEDFPVSISDMELPYRRVRILVEPPYFFVGDGTVPVIFRGNLKDWDASVFSYDKAHFKQFEISDSNRVGLTTISSTTSSTTLGLLTKSSLEDSLIYNDGILIKQLDGIFDTDGLLLWNGEHRLFLYIYFYRNSYEVTDENLNYWFSGKTIDTISKAVLDIAHYSRLDKFKKGGNSILVNRYSATFGDYLYINSDRLGRYEDKTALDSAAIIDVYNIIDNTYKFSFYLGHQPHKKLDGMRIDKNYFVALVDGRIWIYKLKPEYFNSGSNTTHTGQYQE
ncbi:MauE/DoxX family redox-associated membrane protein [Aequorivita antarctica]|uniref:MauE/DoxX family redox-associated membrane protein n=1 Tax=Aequorivita antarctica TaxID=153266 RepID=UPI001B8698FE|nr:MauE/DoxX family redox-associated membrane protein [Aequorivita antarctica]